MWKLIIYVHPARVNELARAIEEKYNNAFKCTAHDNCILINSKLFEPKDIKEIKEFAENFVNQGGENG
jgi:hypothetical protein